MKKYDEDLSITLTFVSFFHILLHCKVNPFPLTDRMVSSRGNIRFHRRLSDQPRTQRPARECSDVWLPGTLTSP